MFEDPNVFVYRFFFLFNWKHFVSLLSAKHPFILFRKFFMTFTSIWKYKTWLLIVEWKAEKSNKNFLFSFFHVFSFSLKNSFHFVLIFTKFLLAHLVILKVFWSKFTNEKKNSKIIFHNSLVSCSWIFHNRFKRQFKDFSVLFSIFGWKKTVEENSISIFCKQIEKRGWKNCFLIVGIYLA